MVLQVTRRYRRRGLPMPDGIYRVQDQEQYKPPEFESSVSNRTDRKHHEIGYAYHDDRRRSRYGGADH